VIVPWRRLRKGKGSRLSHTKEGSARVSATIVRIVSRKTVCHARHQSPKNRRAFVIIIIARSRRKIRRDFSLET
jgi:hypothetical protein